MTSLTLLLVCLVTLTQAIPEKQYDLNDAEHHFEEFIRIYGKKYANDEEKAKRFEIFKETLTDINKRNLEEDLAEFGITEFADIKLDEFVTYLGDYSKRDYQKYGTKDCAQHFGVPDVQTVDSWDWNKEGAVTPVKKQGCKDSYAFSVVGNVEGQYKIKTGQLLSLSEQQVVDCDVRNHHCEMISAQFFAFESLKYMTGLMSSSDYPYKGKQDICTFNITKVKAKVTECDVYFDITEDDLLMLVYQRGPISIGLDPTDIIKYKSGIVQKCRYTQHLHSVLLVGYGTENGVPYWLFKNSFGTEWGEGGFFRLKRGIDACAMLDLDISTSVVAPIED